MKLFPFERHLFKPEVFPRPAVIKLVRLQRFGTRIFSHSLLQYHPARIGNTGIGHFVEQLKIFIPKFQIDGFNIVFEMFELAGGNQHTADVIAGERPGDSNACGTYAVSI